MIQWLYRYIFRSIGIVLVIGMITVLWLAVVSQRRAATKGAHAAPASAARPVR